jgi:hypothetical protein
MLKGVLLRSCQLVLELKSPSDFSPHEAHAHQAFFGWIVPTMKVSEYTVLQIVGLDAAVASLPHNAYAKTSLT